MNWIARSYDGMWKGTIPMVRNMPALILAVWALASPAAEFALERKDLAPDAVFALPGNYGVEVDLTAKGPVGIVKEPPAVSEHPLYGLADVGGTSVAVRLDESKGTRKGYDTLLLDLDGDGDLTNDVACKTGEALPASRYEERWRFGPIELPAAEGRTRGRPTVCAHASIRNRRAIAEGGDVGELEIRSAYILQTMVEFDGVRQTIALLDANCNGCLSDRAVAQLRKDRSGESWQMNRADIVLRDRDGDGRFGPSYPNLEADLLSSLIWFGPDACNLTVANEAMTLRLEPYKGATGTLVVADAARCHRALFHWERTPGRWQILAPELTNGRFVLPAGKHALVMFAIAGNDKDGAAVILETYNDTTEETVEIQKGRPTRLGYGAPLQLQIRTQKQYGRRVGLLDALSEPASSNVSAIEVNVDVIGRGGEKYSGFAKLDNGEYFRPDPPCFTIRDDKGAVLATGQLEYG